MRRRQPERSPSDERPRSDLEPQTLRAGQLGTADVTASTVANIGPGIDFYFAFGAIAATAGVAAPLTILSGAIAAVLLALVVAEFTRAEPSAGGFITYVETAFGPQAGALTALLVGIGYTVAIAGVFAMSGGMVTMTLSHYLGWGLPWEPLTLGFTAGGLWLTARGVNPSTRAVGVSVVFQVAIMLAVVAVVLVDRRHALSASPFSPGRLTGGLGGLSAGFPLALYMFIGWENGAALAEECRDPRRTVPRGLLLSIAAATLLFVAFAYSTVTGFGYHVASVGRASVPFLTVADRFLGGAAVLVWLAGIVSVLATMVSAINSQARMLFDGGRSGLLPGWLGRIRREAGTPFNALLAMGGGGTAIVIAWWAWHAVAGGGNDPVALYAECSTMGTIVILFVYLLTAAALPVFVWRRRGRRLSPVRHVAIPLLGVASLTVPFVELFHPGQPFPYDAFPYLALAILVGAAGMAHAIVRRHPNAGASEGEVVAGPRGAS